MQALTKNGTRAYGGGGGGACEGVGGVGHQVSETSVKWGFRYSGKTEHILVHTSLLDSRNCSVTINKQQQHQEA